MYRIDPYSKEKFIPKRKNQVYKSRETQVNYHNERRKLLRLAKFDIDKQLHLNWSILHDIYCGDIPYDKAREYMEEIGFNTCYSTHIKDNYKMVYNYGYIIKLNKVEVIKECVRL